MKGLSSVRLAFGISASLLALCSQVASAQTVPTRKNLFP